MPPATPLLRTTALLALCLLCHHSTLSKALPRTLTADIATATLSAASTSSASTSSSSSSSTTPGTSPECLGWVDTWRTTVASNLFPFAKDGITREMTEAAVNYSSRYDGGWRVLVHQGKLYAQPFGLTLQWHGEKQKRGELHEDVMFLLKSHCMGMLPEGVEFVYRNGDHGVVAPGDLVPIFSWSRDVPEQNDILFPYGITCLYIRRWERIFEHVPWENKKPIAFWRGATTGDVFTEENWRRLPRTLLVKACLYRPDLCSASFTTFVQIEPEAQKQMQAELGKGADPNRAVPFSHFSRFRYNVLVDGNSAPSSRFLRMLFSGTVLLKQDSPSYEFWYPMLEAGVHYLPLHNNLSNLLDQIRWARHHDDEMQAMAKRAKEWVEHTLTDTTVGCYVQQLLGSYRRLMRYTPEPDQALLSWPVVPNLDLKDTLEKYLDKQCGVGPVDLANTGSTKVDPARQ